MDNTTCIIPNQNDPYVSGFHARAYMMAGRPMIEDVGSRNGIFLGNQKVQGNDLGQGNEKTHPKNSVSPKSPKNRWASHSWVPPPT